MRDIQPPSSREVTSSHIVDTQSQTHKPMPPHPPAVERDTGEFGKPKAPSLTRFDVVAKSTVKGALAGGVTGGVGSFILFILHAIGVLAAQPLGIALPTIAGLFVGSSVGARSGWSKFNRLSPRPSPVMQNWVEEFKAEINELSSQENLNPGVLLAQLQNLSVSLHLFSKEEIISYKEKLLQAFQKSAATKEQLGIAKLAIQAIDQELESR